MITLHRRIDTETTIALWERHGAPRPDERSRAFLEANPASVLCWRGAPVATFNLSRAPELRVATLMNEGQRAAFAQAMGGLGGLGELTWVSFRPDVRRGLFSVLLWWRILHEVAACPAERVVFFTIEPKIRALYASCDFEQVFACDVAYLALGTRRLTVFQVTPRAVYRHLLKGCWCRLLGWAQGSRAGRIVGGSRRTTAGRTP